MMTKGQRVGEVLALAAAVLNMTACGSEGSPAPLAATGPAFVNVSRLDARQPWLGSLGETGQVLLAMPLGSAAKEANNVLASTRLDAKTWSPVETVPGTVGAGVAEAALVGDGVAVSSLMCTTVIDSCIGPARLNISYRTVDDSWRVQSNLGAPEVNKVLASEGAVSVSLVEAGSATILYARSENGDSATALIQQDGNEVRLKPTADPPVGVWRQCVTSDNTLVSVHSAADRRVSNGIGHSDPNATESGNEAVEVEVRIGDQQRQGWETQRGVSVQASDDVGVTCTDAGAVLGTTDKLVRVSTTSKVSGLPAPGIGVPEAASYSSPVASHPGQLVVAVDEETTWITAIRPNASLAHASVDLGSPGSSVDGAAVSGSRATLLVRDRTLVKQDPPGEDHHDDETPRPEDAVTFRILDVQLKDL